MCRLTTIRVLLFVLILATFAGVYWTAFRTRIVIPAGSMFTGEAGGCGNFSVYRLNSNKSLAISVQLDEKAIPLSEGPQSFQIEQHPEAICVQVLQFPRRLRQGDEYFCTDVFVPSLRPIWTWKALSGKLLVTNDTSPPHYGNATYRITVRLTDVVFQQEQDSTIQVELEAVEINDVWVGWLAG